MEMEETIVEEWLRSLQLEQYADSFIDNGYDDLEICKQIGAPDLDAIGVVNPGHRTALLNAVMLLREEGAASVYFTVEEAQLASRDHSSLRNSSGSRGRSSRSSRGSGSTASTPGDPPAPVTLGMAATNTPARYLDAYEAGRAELVRLPHTQLSGLLKERLVQDAVDLAAHPYTTQDGQRGVLEGLASRYADQFSTHYQDVFDHLDRLRLDAWNQLINRVKNPEPISPHSPSPPPDPCPTSPKHREGDGGGAGSPPSQTRPEGSHPSSHSSSPDHRCCDDHPVYVPGKYNPSSCLSDAEEDQIYGYSSGGYRGTARRPPTLAHSNHAFVHDTHGCLNPRSTLIYELPPVGDVSRGANGKKRLGIGKFLKTLKRDLKRTSATTSNKNNKNKLTHNLNNLPRSYGEGGLATTPLVMLPGYSSPASSRGSHSSHSHSSHSHSSSHSTNAAFVSASAPGTPGSSGPIRDSGLQEAIERLKEQEMQRRREEQFREHEQILRDLRQGLLRSERPMRETAIFYTKGAPYQDDTYMYDDDVGEAGAGAGVGVLGPPHHWYDEPPYESDPEDFLIGKDAYRESYGGGLRVVVTEEDIISLRTAGDISVPRDVAKVAHTQWATGGGPAYPPRPPHSPWVEPSGHGGGGYPVPVYDNVRLVSMGGGRTAVGRVSRRSEPDYPHLEGVARGAPRHPHRPLLREGGPTGDVAAADVHSVTSRLSGVSVETNRSDPTELRLSKYLSRSSMSGGSEDGQSPSHSSDYEEQDEAERPGSASFVGRMRGLRRDMQKKISRLKSPRGSTSSSPGPLGAMERPGASLSAPGSGPHTTAASCESIPTAAPPAVPPSGSNRSSLSGEDAEPYTGPFIGRARALVDYQPSPYDRDALKFKKGDTIDLIAKNPSGLWKGCVDGRVGHFKFILVEEEVERPVRKSRTWRGNTPRRGRSRTLEELLNRLHLGHLLQVFMLNGYEDLDQFRDLEKADLDCLGITDPETCAKLLTAVALLHDVDSEPEPDLPETLETTEVALRRGDHGRDSGCYTDHRCSTQPPSVLDESNLDTRQSTPSTDTSSGYHSRGPYNLAVGETGQSTRDDAQGSALDSPPSEATTITSGTATLPSSTSESHSYRAHPATVLPASPHSQARHAHHQGDPRMRQDPDVDYEAKFVTARSVFEKEVVRREVPVSVRGQKRSTDSQQAAGGESEQAGSSEADGDAAELPP